MNLLELISRRHSVRHYAARPVEKEKIGYLLECARLAPSACNRQPWRLLVVESAEPLRALHACYPRDWFREAPLCIAVCVDGSEAWVRPSDGRSHGDVDAAIAAEHICLAAEEQGLGCCWVCAFDPERCAEALHIEAPLRPVALLPVGYPADEAPVRKLRKPAEEIYKFL